MKHILTFILLLSCITGAYSQESNNPLIDQGSEVILDRHPENDFFYTHVFEKGQTVYSLARVFRVSVADIFSANNISAQTPINVGQIVKVPFNTASLYTEQSGQAKPNTSFVPVYYIARAKETLYGIGKTYFGQDVATFSKRNKIEGSVISIGQKLLVGWLPLKDGIAIKVNTTIEKSEKPLADGNVLTKLGPIITPESITESDDLSVPDPDRIKEKIAAASETIPDSLASRLELIETEEPKIPTTIIRKTRGIGIWERDSKVNGMAFVLHHTAKRGTMMEIYNPQLNLRTTAKVLGPIPPATYPSDVTIIMSKKVADSLGALDTRFMVDLTFTEDIKTQ